MARYDQFRPASPGSPDFSSAVHTVHPTPGPVSGGSAPIGGEVGTSGIQGDVHQVRTGLHLAPWAAAVRIRNVTSGTRGVAIAGTGLLHLAIGRKAAGPPSGGFIHRGKSRACTWPLTGARRLRILGARLHHRGPQAPCPRFFSGFSGPSGPPITRQLKPRIGREDPAPTRAIFFASSKDVNPRRAGSLHPRPATRGPAPRIH